MIVSEHNHLVTMKFGYKHTPEEETFQGNGFVAVTALDLFSVSKCIIVMIRIVNF